MFSIYMMLFTVVNSHFKESHNVHTHSIYKYT